MSFAVKTDIMLRKIKGIRNLLIGVTSLIEGDSFNDTNSALYFRL